MPAVLSMREPPVSLLYLIVLLCLCELSRIGILLDA